MTDAEAVMRELATVWNSREADRLGDLFATNARFEDVAFGMTREGIDEIRAMFHETWAGIPDLHTELTRVVADVRSVAAEWSLTGTHTGDFPDLPATGREISIRGVSVAAVRDGKIREQRDYYDRAAFLEQLGRRPAD